MKNKKSKSKKRNKYKRKRNYNEMIKSYPEEEKMKSHLNFISP